MGRYATALSQRFQGLLTALERGWFWWLGGALVLVIAVFLLGGARPSSPVATPGPSSSPAAAGSTAGGSTAAAAPPSSAVTTPTTAASAEATTSSTDPLSVFTADATVTSCSPAAGYPQDVSFSVDIVNSQTYLADYIVRLGFYDGSSLVGLAVHDEPGIAPDAHATWSGLQQLPSGVPAGVTCRILGALPTPSSP